MTSAIDPTLPVYGTPTTASVRSNFTTAANEITALQAAIATGGGGGVASITAGPGLTGGTITTSGTIALANPVTVAMGGTNAQTAPLALDSLSGASGATAGVLSRAAGGTWSVAVPAGGGNVTAAALTTNALVIGSGATAIVSLGTGSATTVLHGGGAAAPTFSAVNLTPGGDVTGILPLLNGGTGATTAPNALASLGAVPIAGGTMTGGLVMGTPPDGNLGVGTVDASSCLYINHDPTYPITQVAGFSNTVIQAQDTVPFAIRLRGSGLPRIEGWRSGGTNQTPAANTANNLLVQINGHSYAPPGTINPAGWSATQTVGIEMATTETQTDPARGSKIHFNTTPSGGTVGAPAVMTTQMALWRGLVVGSGTFATSSTNDAGPGTINVQNGVYVNGTLLTPGAGADTYAAVTAAGTSQANAFALSATVQFNEVTAGPAGSGVILPAGAAAGGSQCKIRNSLATPVLVYPATGATINAQAVNTAISVNANSTAYFESAGTLRWFTIP